MQPLKNYEIHTNEERGNQNLMSRQQQEKFHS